MWNLGYVMEIAVTWCIPREELGKGYTGYASDVHLNQEKRNRPDSKRGGYRPPS
jgi:hypothetical protein